MKINDIIHEGIMNTIKGAAKELTRDSLQRKIKQAWERTFWPKHIEPALNRIQIDGQPFRRMVLGEPRVIENTRSQRAVLKQYTVDIVFPIDPNQWSGDEIQYLEAQLQDIQDGDWNPKVHGLGLVSFEQPIKSFQYTRGEIPDLVIPVRITSLDINRGLVGEQGVAEGINKNVVKSVKVGDFRHDLVDTGFGWQVRIYNGDELYDTGISKNSEQKGLAALDDAVAYTKKQLNIKEQDMAEGINFYDRFGYDIMAPNDKKQSRSKGESKWHISPSGVKTNMSPTDDDYEINYGKNGLVAKDRRSRGVDVRTGSRKVKKD